MSERIRYALYYTPAPGSVLAAYGARILGADSVFTGDAARAVAITAEPRIYGFHATLKAPMRLAPGVTETDLLDAAATLAGQREPVPVGRLAVALMGDVAALVPEEPPADLGLFAAECVAWLDPLRAPLTEAERARRRPEHLDARRRTLLDRWGYPHVFDTFRFHMTLTGRLAPEDRETWLASLRQAYADAPAVVIDAISIVRQDGAEPFRLLHRIPLRP